MKSLFLVMICLLVWPLDALAGEDATSAMCSGNAAGARDCRPAPGSPDENMPEAVLTLPGVTINRQISLAEQKPAWAANACQVQTRISYSQRYDQVVVDAVISNHTCAASQGQYQLSVRWRDADGNSQRAEHSASWQREANKDTLAPITQQHRYQIDPEHQLQWVKVSSQPKTACTCSSASAPYPP